MAYSVGRSPYGHDVLRKSNHFFHGRPQAAAENGKYALAMAAHVQRLARLADAGGLSSRLEARRRQLRADAISGAHTRMPDNIASLMVGTEEFLNFSVEVGAITDSERTNLRARAWEALNEQVTAQMSLASGSDPASRFIALIAAVVSAKRTNIAGTNGGGPNNATVLGWDCKASGEHLNMVANGPVIGWLERDDLYLEAEAPMAVANKLAREQGIKLPFTDRREYGQIFTANNDSLMVALDVEKGTLRDKPSPSPNLSNRSH